MADVKIQAIKSNCELRIAKMQTTGEDIVWNLQTRFESARILTRKHWNNFVFFCHADTQISTLSSSPFRIFFWLAFHIDYWKIDYLAEINKIDLLLFCYSVFLSQLWFLTIFLAVHFTLKCMHIVAHVHFYT